MDGYRVLPSRWGRRVCVVVITLASRLTYSGVPLIEVNWSVRWDMARAKPKSHNLTWNVVCADYVREDGICDYRPESQRLVYGETVYELY